MLTWAVRCGEVEETLALFVVPAADSVELYRVDVDSSGAELGAIVATQDGVLAPIDRAGHPLLVPPQTLLAVQTVYVMRVHRSQGSEYEAVSLVLPRQPHRC